MISRNVTQARAAAFASHLGAEPAWGGGKGVTPARDTGGRTPGPKAQGPCGEAEGTPGRASAPARCTIPVAGGGQGALCLLGPDPRSSLGQTRGAAWASRAPPQTKNSNSGQVSAAPGTRVADSAPGRRQRRAPPTTLGPAYTAGSQVPDPGLGPSAAPHPCPPAATCAPGRTRSPRSAPGEAGWAEGPGISGVPLFWGRSLPLPCPPKSRSLSGVRSAHSPRRRPRRSPLVPGPEPGCMEAGVERGPRVAPARPGDPSPRVPCSAGARAGDAHVRRAGSARSGRHSVRSRPPGGRRARRGTRGGGRGAGRAGGGSAGGAGAGRGQTRLIQPRGADLPAPAAGPGSERAASDRGHPGKRAQRRPH